jgi:hypothetical protein
MIDDDELPILTQVLRTGSGHPAALARVAPAAAAAAAEPDARVEPSFARALVIGSDPEDDDLPASYKADAIADPRRIDLKSNDVFLRSAPTHEAFTDTIDEPDLLASTALDDEPDAFTTVASVEPGSFGRRPLIIHAEADPQFAARIREAVLDDLSSRIDTELDARIAQTLHAGLEAAIAQLQVSLRAELAEALRDVVGHAVEDAIRRTRPASPSDDR